MSVRECIGTGQVPERLRGLGTVGQCPTCGSLIALTVDGKLKSHGSWADGTYTLQCDMSSTCKAEVTHIDQGGYVYCTVHGEVRRSLMPCRKLRAHELIRLRKGETVNRY